MMSDSEKIYNNLKNLPFFKEMRERNAEIMERTRKNTIEIYKREERKDIIIAILVSIILLPVLYFLLELIVCYILNTKI